MLDEQLGGGREREVVGANEQPAPPVPVVKPVRTREGEQRRIRRKAGLDALEPGQRRAAIGIQVHEHVALRKLPARVTRDDQPLAGLVHDPHVRNLERHGARLIGAGVVYHQDFVGQPRLRQEGMQTSGEIPCFVMSADNDADPHPSTVARDALSHVEGQRHRCA